MELRSYGVKGRQAPERGRDANAMRLPFSHGQWRLHLGRFLSRSSNLDRNRGWGTNSFDLTRCWCLSGS